jgi:hypothetical protein
LKRYYCTILYFPDRICYTEFMRIFGFIVALFLVFWLIPTTKVQAACNGAMCTKTQVQCIGNGPVNFTGQCCDTAAECPSGTRPAGVSQTYNICDSVPDAQHAACIGCMTNTGDSTQKTWTAIGCIQTDPNDLLGWIIKLGMGLAGGIAFLLILFGGLQIMTSAGNPEQLNAGRELVSSAITGLILIIFSVFLLSFIGINIIGIPGFATGQQGTMGPR